MDGFGKVFFTCEIYAPLSEVDGQVNRDAGPLRKINVKREMRLHNAIIRGRDYDRND